MDVRDVEQRAPTSRSTTAESSQSAVSWSAILCGAAVAAATSLILVALGSGLGLASVSPWSDRGLSPAAFTAGAAIWLIVTQWVASAVGGYLTGRLRTKWVDIHTHEVFLRDTAHGFVTWAVATVTVAFVVAGGALTAGAAASLQTATLNPTRSNPTADSYDVDVLFRGLSDKSSTATDPRPEALRILAKGLASGNVPTADRSYLAALVSSRAGIPQSEAAQRVDTFVNNSKSTIDTARKVSSAAAVITALSMLIGAFVACAAGALGGRERDARAIVH
jgi:pyocin large subunit-like protein